VYPKMPGEPPRVAPSRAKKESPGKEAAQAGETKAKPKNRAPRTYPPGKSRGI
jgi:hypothetical protein